MKRTIVAAALALAALSALSSSSEAQRRPRVISYAVDPGCNRIFPCEGVAPSERGAQIAKVLGIGVARLRYAPAGQDTIVDRARAYMGQTAAQIGVRRSLWCSAFLRKITGATGVDDRAISWIRKPHVAAAIGTIAVMRHHVGIVSGFDVNGNPIIVSGNHRHRVGEGVYPRSRILAWVRA